MTSLGDSNHQVPLCSLREIAKSFGPVKAVDNVSEHIYGHEILAIVGENGAGKSTLMGMLYGLLRPDAGTIEIEGTPVYWRSPRDAIDAHMGMVHQHFMLYPSLSVLENILVGSEIVSAFGFIDETKARPKIEKLCAEFGFDIDLDAPVETLPVGMRQQVEIVKMLFRGAKITILDEPTSMLTPQEKDNLFVMLRQLRQSGHAIVIITHKLGEVMELSDRIMVMRDGKKVAELNTADTSQSEIARHMVGREITSPPKTDVNISPNKVLQVQGLTVLHETGTPAVTDISLDIHQGEIVGIAGVSGNGQREFVEALTGLRPVADGKVLFCSKDITNLTTGERRDRGVAYIAADRTSVSLATSASVAENFLGGWEGRNSFSKWGILNWPKIRQHATALIEQFNIVTTGPDQSVASLSGGNKQKVVAGRELFGDPKLIIAQNPTWGVDVAAIALIQERILQKAAAGSAILLVSSDLEELFVLCDRIIVFFEGQISGTFNRDQLDAYAVGRAMSASLPQAETSQ